MQVAGSGANRLTLLGLSLATWLADALCLQLAMRAAGVSVPFPVLLLAYTVGVLATLVPLLPGGLGLVEAAIPLVLASFGVPVAAALAGTLAYRAIGTVLPAGAGALAVPGMLLARRAGPAGRRPEPALARAAAA